jgi:hypothetical protein
VKIAHRPGLRSVLDYLRMDDTLVILQCNRLALPVKQLLGLFVLRQIICQFTTDAPALSEKHNVFLVVFQMCTLPLSMPY